MRKILSYLFAVPLLIALSAPVGSSQTEPREETVFSSTGCVTCLAVTPAGTLWVGTTGGVVCYDPKTSNRQRFTIADGLPGQEVRAIKVDANRVTAFCATGAVEWNGKGWRAVASVKPDPLLWQGKSVTRDGSGIKVNGISMGFPSGSKGSVVSAVTVGANGDLLMALFGDAMLYRWNGMAFSSEVCDLPEGAGKEITAVCESPTGALYVGTRRHGVYCRSGVKELFQRLAGAADEPYAHNAQAFQRFRGTLYISTLEDGLCTLSEAGWGVVCALEISSNAPRQMTVFQDHLYVRHGSGKVDRFDGAIWEKNVFSSLPRKQVSAMMSDGKALYLGQWGGWSAYDGRAVSHHLNIAALQGVPVTAFGITPDGKTLYVGTQGRGLFEWDVASEAIVHRHDLTDDWVTDIAIEPGGSVLAGTFVGGLCRQAPGRKWQVVPTTEGENITGIIVTRLGTFAATRHGVRKVEAENGNKTALIYRQDSEAQCLFAGGTGLWVGTRTGIVFSPYRILTADRE